jgi:hypothetical protein
MSSSIARSRAISRSTLSIVSTASRVAARASAPPYRAFAPIVRHRRRSSIARSRHRVASRRVASSDGRVARESHASSDGRVASRRARTERAQLPELALYRALRPSRILAQILPRPRRRRRRHPRVAAWRRSRRARAIDRSRNHRAIDRATIARSIDRPRDRSTRASDASIAPLEALFREKAIATATIRRGVRASQKRDATATRSARDFGRRCGPSSRARFVANAGFGRSRRTTTATIHPSIARSD